jgi:hypothetical protein
MRFAVLLQLLACAALLVAPAQSVSILDWVPVSDAARATTAASYVVGLLNLNRLYLRPVMMDSVVSAVQSNTSPLRYSIAISLNSLGSKTIVSLETYQDNLMNWKLVILHPLKNQKKNPYEVLSMASDLWLQVPANYPIAIQASKALLLYLQSYGGKTGYTVSSLPFHAELLARDLALELQFLQSRVEFSQRVADNSVAEQKALKQQQASLLKQLQTVLNLNNVNAVKTLNVQTLSQRVKNLDSSITKADLKAASSASSKRSIEAAIPKLLLEIQREQAQRRSGTFDSTLRNYIYLITEIFPPNSPIGERVQSVLYKDEHGIWSVMGSVPWNE